jgi:large subunit ribosomal protein L13
VKAKKMIIDATDTILGRIATHAVKASVAGEEVIIINCEKAVITGDRNYVKGKYEHRMNMGTPGHGPFLPTEPHMLMKRTIRGMTEHKKSRGDEILKRILCYTGVPSELKDKKTEVLKNAQISKLSKMKITYMGELCTFLCGKRY